MSGPISEYLAECIEGKLQRRRILVWYDAKQVFGRLLEDYTFPKATVVGFDGSYFKLRHDVEPLVAKLHETTAEVENLLVYVPRARLEDRENILLGLECLGTTFTDGLAAITQQALKGSFPRATVQEWLKRPQISLAQLDDLARKEENIAPLDVVFGKISPKQVGVRLLCEPGLAAEVDAQELFESLSALLQRTYGVKIPSGVTDAEELRDAFAHHVLLVEFLDDLADTPAELRRFAIPDSRGEVIACRQLAQELRDSRSTEDAYRRWAEEAERAYGLAELDYPAETLGQEDTFSFEERLALRHVRQLAAEDKWAEAIKWAQERADSFWARTDVQRSRSLHVG